MQGNEQIYEAECESTPCFAHNFGDPQARRTSYDEFKRLNSKWQHKLGTLFTDCLASSETVQTRNALNILNRTVKVPPPSIP